MFQYRFEHFNIIDDKLSTSLLKESILLQWWKFSGSRKFVSDSLMLHCQVFANFRRFPSLRNFLWEFSAIYSTLGIFLIGSVASKCGEVLNSSSVYQLWVYLIFELFWNYEVSHLWKTNQNLPIYPSARVDPSNGDV